MTDETVCTGFFRAATDAKGDISCLDQFQSSGVLEFISGNFLEAFYNVPIAIINAPMWLDWLTWENTLEDKQSLMRFVYYGGSVEFFFVLATLILGMTIYGMINNKFMWNVVRVLEGFANTVGRFFAWAGLLMVLQQIMIVFLQRIFTRPDISIGFGIPLQFDISWFAEELKLYNALVICMCVTYAFVQGSHENKT